jgi:hypothetical protein
MNVSIHHPTNRPNFTIVFIGDLKLAFSYNTIIGFITDWRGWTVSENIWSTTTGKHLNYLDDGDKSNRVSRDEFTRLLNRELERLNI